MESTAQRLPAGASVLMAEQTQRELRAWGFGRRQSTLLPGDRAFWQIEAKEGN
jgi:hypothetical protein